MARSFRQSRFRSRTALEEDVNPSAYIVNLADCMLVLACGFMVAMITYWNIDVSKVTELDQGQLEQVNPETLPQAVDSGGSYYVEAGTVYMDPNTGQLYMVQETESQSASSDASAQSAGTQAQSTSQDISGQSASTSSSTNSRANGAD